MYMKSRVFLPIRLLLFFAAMVIAGALCFGQTSLSAFEQMNSRGDGPLPEPEGEEIWNTLSRMPSASQGSGAVLYVLAYSSCPYTNAFFRDYAGKLDNTVQLRWIFYHVDGEPATLDTSADVALTKDPSVVTAILNHQRASPPYRSSRQSINAYSSVLLGFSGLNGILVRNGQNPIISPTFVFKNGETVYVHRGYEKGAFEKFTLAHVGLAPILVAGITTLSTTSSPASNAGGPHNNQTLGSGVIITYAGTYGKLGHLGDLGPASQSQLSAPFALAVDQAKNLYIADNIYVRKVDHSTGIITTIAGAGNTWGDGELATRAELWSPRGLAFDPAGNLYIADAVAEVIRKVDHISGIITTVVGIPSANCASGFCFGNRGYSGDGGSAAKARLSQPKSVVFDTAGDMYIADTGNSVIRRVSASKGIIETVVGTPPGIAAGCAKQTDAQGDGCLATNVGLGLFSAMTVDTAGNLYFSHTYRGISFVRRVDHETGIVSLVAGGGRGCIQQKDEVGDACPALSAQLSNIEALAFDSSENLYFSDFKGVHVIAAASGVIRRAIGAGGYSGDGGPAANASLGAVDGLAFDAGGDLYIADRVGVVRKVTK